MKNAVVIVLVAACIAFSQSAPSSSKTPKWTDVTTKAQQLKSALLFDSSLLGDITPQNDWLLIAVYLVMVRNFALQLFDNIKLITENVDESLKNSIHAKVDAALNQTNPLFQQGVDLVNSQRLSRKHVIDLFDNQLLDQVTNLSKNLQPELDQVSDELKSIITNVINLSKADLSEHTFRLHVAIDVIQVDVAEGAQNVHNYLLTVLEEIRTVANNDNEEVGAEIALYLDSFVDFLDYFYEQITTLISQGDFEEREADWYLRGLRGNYLQLPNAIKGLLLQLNVSAAAEIIEIVSSGLDGLDNKGEELNRLLSKDFI